MECRGGGNLGFTLAEGATHVGTPDSKQRFGFTLAEVLITLGIIGVVAAMTMPTLIQNHQKRSLEVATKKFYSMMSQAVRQYMADEGVDDLRNTPIAREYYNDNYGDGGSEKANKAFESQFLNKYLKVIKKCENSSECFANGYKGWGGTEEGGISKDYDFGYGNTYVLSDGSVTKIAIRPFIDMWVDVNGKKGPNRVGYDLWSMDIFYDGVIDESGVGPERRKGEQFSSPDCAEDDTVTECRTERYRRCREGELYGGCFGHFLENNFKFDY